LVPITDMYTCIFTFVAIVNEQNDLITKSIIHQTLVHTDMGRKSHAAYIVHANKATQYITVTVARESNNF